MKKAILIALSAVLVALVAIGGQATTAQAEASMHNCPRDGEWAIAVWTGEEVSADEALGTCAIEAAYAYDNGGMTRWFPNAPEGVNTIITLDQYDGVIALGGPTVPVAEPETNVSIFGTLPDDCTVNDLAMAIRSAGDGHAHARTGLHTLPLQIVDGIATRVWAQMAIVKELCFYCDGEFLVCADVPKASGDAHHYAVKVLVSGNAYEILPREHEYMTFYVGDGRYARLGYGGKIPFNPTCPTDAWMWDDDKGFWCEGYPDAVFLAYECGPDQEPEAGETYCNWDR